MDPAAAVLACALDLLGASARGLSRIELVPAPPKHVSLNTNGYVRTGVPTIYLVTSSPIFRAARCRDRRSVIMLAAVIMHEESHVRGADEQAAYERQLYTLLRLGLTPDTMEYRAVRLSMKAALEERAPPPMKAPEIATRGEAGLLAH